VGLTGGIATGKSRILSRFASRGFATLDLDLLAREVMSPSGPAHAPVVRAFGEGIVSPDGTIDRTALASRVFADSAERERLNAIVHPLVREAEVRQTRTLTAGPEPVLVTDAALLVEVGAHLRFDRLVVAHCRAEQQVERLVRRDGLSIASAESRVRSQMPNQEKTRLGHLVIDTSGTLADTDNDADRAAVELEAVARAPRRRVNLPLERQLGCLVSGPTRGPRGLHPGRLLHLLAAEADLEMGALARVLVPPRQGPWYLGSAPQEALPGPEALAAPLVVWILARRGRDEPYLLGAISALAHLTHGTATGREDGCFMCLALLELAADGVPGDTDAALERWRARTREWCGVAPAGRVVNAVRAGLAGAGAGLRGEDVGLAGAVDGILTGRSAETAPPQLGADLEALERRR
jgi:dephospho-CoA kinase